jgi:hypothetical protein
MIYGVSATYFEAGWRSYLAQQYRVSLDTLIWEIHNCLEHQSGPFVILLCWSQRSIPARVATMATARNNAPAP